MLAWSIFSSRAADGVCSDVDDNDYDMCARCVRVWVRLSQCVLDFYLQVYDVSRRQRCSMFMPREYLWDGSSVGSSLPVFFFSFFCAPAQTFQSGKFVWSRLCRCCGCGCYTYFVEKILIALGWRIFILSKKVCGTVGAVKCWLCVCGTHTHLPPAPTSLILWRHEKNNRRKAHSKFAILQPQPIENTICSPACTVFPDCATLLRLLACSLARSVCVLN